jgi:hypothetical protein
VAKADSWGSGFVYHVGKCSYGEGKMMIATDSGNMTEWFPPTTKPVHPGEYEVQRPWIFPFMGRSVWNGKHWISNWTGHRALFQNLNWRGVVAAPED